MKNQAYSNTDARYVRIKAKGNTANNWTFMTELDNFGMSSSSASFSLYNYAPGFTATVSGNPYSDLGEVGYLINVSGC